MQPVDGLLILAGFCFSFVISTLIVRKVIPLLNPDNPQLVLFPDALSNKAIDLRAAGFWIGFCETFLIFVLVLADEFGALAIIIGAKEFVRKERIEINPSYYLLGTLANLSVALLFAIFVCAMIS